MFPNRQPNNNRAFDVFGNEIYDPFGTAQHLQQQQQQQQQQPQQNMFGGFGFQQPMMQMPQMQPMMQMPQMQMPQMQPMMQMPQFGNFGNFGFPDQLTTGGATTSFSSSSFSSSGGNGGQGYVTTTTSSMGPGGVMETKTIARDSSGKKKVVTKRQIGDKAVEEIEEHDGVKGSTHQRKIENLGVEDLNLFDSEWSQKKAQLPQIQSSHHGIINGRQFDDGVRALPGSTGPSIQMLEDGKRRSSKTQGRPNAASQMQRDPQNGSSLHRSSNVNADVDDDVVAEGSGDGVIRASAVEEPEFIPTEVINNTQQQKDQQKQQSARRHYQEQSSRGGVVIQEIEDFDETKPD